MSTMDRVMSPAQFRDALAKERKSADQEKGEAYEEFVANCRALTLKANTAIAQHTDDIVSGSSLNFERNYIGSAGLQAISTLLSKNDNLVSIRLPANGIGNDAVVFFCRSMRNHPSLSSIDLSSNDTISLAGGMALLSLVRQNSNVTSIKLDGSQIPEPVMVKINRALESNQMSQSSGKKKVSTKLAENVAIGRQQLKEASRLDRWRQREAAELVQLREKINGMIINGRIPPPSPSSGWRVLEIVILSPPGIFESEHQGLLEKVFPRLNEELKSRRILLIPIINAADSPPGTYLRRMRFSLSCDIVADVFRSRFIAVELIGDRPGDYEQPPSNQMIDAALQSATVPTLTPNGNVETVVSALDPSAPPLNPVLYQAHEEVMNRCNWILIASRQSTRQLGVPPALAPLFSCEPSIEHPDKHKSLVKKVQVETTLCKPDEFATLTGTTSDEATTTIVSARVKVEPSSRIGCSHLVEQMKWDELQAFKADAIANAPVQELVVEDYYAKFDSTRPSGELVVRDIDEFLDSIYQRLSIVLTSVFPVVEEESPDDFSGPKAISKFCEELIFQRSVDRMYCEDMATYGGHKRTITNRLNLYVTTPPSRNSLVLHSQAPYSLCPLICMCAKRFFASSSHTVAYHNARSPAVGGECRDLRWAIVHIISQLTTNAEVLRYLRTEVDVTRLKRFFSSFISGGTRADESNPSVIPKITANAISSFSASEEEKVFLVVLDGFEALEAPVKPCTALRQSESGVDEWDIDMPNSWKVLDDGVDFIPKCLARNVRLLMSSTTSFPLLERLRSRGRDSCELLDAGESTANDIQVWLSPANRERLGISLSDDEHLILQRKKDSGNPEYIGLFIDEIRQLSEAPGYVKQSELISSYPEDLEGAASRILQNLITSFGQPLTRKVVGLLSVSRWGLALPDLRALLKLPPKRFNELLRRLRPVVRTVTSDQYFNRASNALLDIVYFVAPSFRELLKRESYQNEGAEEDDATWHGMLAQYYQSIVISCMNSEKTLIYRTSPHSPLELNAVKELVYHLACAKMWGVIDSLILSPKFMMLVYRNGVAFQYLRDLTFAFNQRNTERYLHGDTGADGGRGGKNKTFVLSPALNRMKDFIYFIKNHSAILIEYPHLVLQATLQLEERSGCVKEDSLNYLRRQFANHHVMDSSAFFQAVPTNKPKVHLGELSTLFFAWNRKHVISGGSDRSICWTEPNTGTIAYQVHQPSARVCLVLYCSTSAYVAALTVSRSVYIYDGAFGKLISKNEGDDFASPVASFSFSARGRYYAVATEDVIARVYDSEKGCLVCTLDASMIAANCPDVHHKRNVIELLNHPVDDEVFYTIVNDFVCTWRIAETRDCCTNQAASALPCVCTKPQWCWNPNLSGEEFSENQSRYVLTQTEDNAVAVVDIVNGVIASQYRLPERTTISKLALSSNHNLLAVGTVDGTVAVFRLDWLSISNETVPAPDEYSPPSVIFSAFQSSAIPAISDLGFRYDSQSLFALGNENHLKYWRIPELNDEVQVVSRTAGGYVHSEKVTAMSLSRAAEQGAVEVALGDASGELILLKLFFPHS